MNIFYVDGGCHNNSQHGQAYGSFWYQDHVYRFDFGEGTNNQAEYKALIEVLKFARDEQIIHPKIFTDSNLMVQQLKGVYQVKNPGLRPLKETAWRMLNQLHGEISWVGRDEIVAKVGH